MSATMKALRKVRSARGLELESVSIPTIGPAEVLVRVRSASVCVRQNPADFWEFAQILYTSQAQIDSNNLRARIEAFAKAQKLDSEALNKCMLGKSADEVIVQDQRDGMIAHVQSTPTFLINGIPVIGLPEEKSFDFVLKSQLKDSHPAPASGG